MQPFRRDLNKIIDADRPERQAALRVLLEGFAGRGGPEGPLAHRVLNEV